MVKGLNPHIWEIGKIKIGGKGEKKISAAGNDYYQSEKYDHFKIVFNQIDDSQNFIENLELKESIKALKNIKINEDGELLEIPVSLLYDDISMNIPTRYAYYSGRNLACTGDGEKAQDNLLGEKKCPCDKLKNNECKLNGMLKCKIKGTDFIGGCHIFRTTGFNAVNSAIGFMEYVKELTNGVLAEINFSLILESKIMRPAGKPANLGYVPCLIYKGSVDDLRKEALEIVKKENEFLDKFGERRIKKNKGNSEITFIDADDENNFVSEFYPEKGEKQDGKIIAPIAAEKEQIEQSESSKINDSDVVESAFEQYKDKILQAYSDLINCDRASWQVMFSEAGISMPTDIIFDSCKSNNWNNAQYWHGTIKNNNPDKKENELPNIETLSFFIGTLAGRKTWNDALKKHNIKSVKELTDFEGFLRDVNDIPF